MVCHAVPGYVSLGCPGSIVCSQGLSAGPWVGHPFPRSVILSQGVSDCPWISHPIPRVRLFLDCLSQGILSVLGCVSLSCSRSFCPRVCFPISGRVSLFQDSVPGFVSLVCPIIYRLYKGYVFFAWVCQLGPGFVSLVRPRVYCLFEGLSTCPFQVYHPVLSLRPPAFPAPGQTVKAGQARV